MGTMGAVRIGRCRWPLTQFVGIKLQLQLLGHQRLQVRHIPVQVDVVQRMHIAQLVFEQCVHGMHGAIKFLSFVLFPQTRGDPLVIVFVAV